MNVSTKKWLFLKISSVILIPLMLWFILNFVSIYYKSYNEIIEFFSNTTSKFLFSLFIVFDFLNISLMAIDKPLMNSTKKIVFIILLNVIKNFL